MTHPNDVPDWRDRLTHRRPTPVPVSASRPSRGLWSSEGVVTSELEADWEVRAGGSRAVLRLSILTYVGSLAVSGQLGALLTSLSVAVLPLVVLVVVLVVVASLLPGGRFVAGALVGAGVRGFCGARRRPGPNAPGRQITLAGPSGERRGGAGRQLAPPAGGHDRPGLRAAAPGPSTRLVRASSGRRPRGLARRGRGRRRRTAAPAAVGPDAGRGGGPDDRRGTRPAHQPARSSPTTSTTPSSRGRRARARRRASCSPPS